MKNPNFFSEQTAMQQKEPLVLLAGRTNVGKSALFNRIVGRQVSLVLDREGVTRDWIEESVKWHKNHFKLADIGGLEKGGIIEDLIRAAFFKKLEQAVLVVMVCDVSTGPTSKDVEIAKILRKSGKEVILIVNKADDESKDRAVFEFTQLGLGKPMAISALHARGVGDLLDLICEKIIAPTKKEEDEKPVGKICIVGKPNTGKSSLLNFILGRERSIVSDLAGTTRESIIDTFSINGKLFQFTDTAGVRRKRSVEDELEIMMVKTSMEAIRRSDLAIMMIDGSEEKICAQELKILSYAIEQKKAIILAVNKSDLMGADAIQFLNHSLEEYPQLTKKIPLIKISCKEGRNIEKLKGLVERIWTRCRAEFDEEFIDELLKENIIKRPLFKQDHAIKVWRVRIVKDVVPAFHIKFNMPILIDDSHLRYIENILRSKLDLFGCPVRLSYS